MSRWLAIPAALLSLLLLVTTPTYAAVPPTVDDIAEKLICQCGCLMVLNNCSHSECSSRETMLGVISQKLTQGQSSDQIVSSFVAQYGEKVLSEPPKKGFNLTAWLFPIVALAVGSIVVYLALKKWARKRDSQPAVAVETTADDEAYQQRLEVELKEFPERGFR